MSNWREKPSCQGIKIILNIFKLKKKKNFSSMPRITFKFFNVFQKIHCVHSMFLLMGWGGG